MVKISIITVCLNAAKTIEKTIESVIAQDYPNTEYIVIDGNSTDNTLKIIEHFTDDIDIMISEKDNGLYDAINKGIRLASGEIIGILNADDFFINKDVISNVANSFNSNNKLDSVFGDIAYINKNGYLIRYYSSKKWRPWFFRFGMMPPHPSFFCRRELYLKLGLYRTDFKISADYELMLRYLKIYKISYKYIPILMVLMRPGGISTKGISSLITINQEIIKAHRINNYSVNYITISMRYFQRFFQFVIIKNK